MKINSDTFPVLSLIQSLFTDTNKARVAAQLDEIRRFFLYEAGHWYVLLSLALMSFPMIVMSAGKDIAYGLFTINKAPIGLPLFLSSNFAGFCCFMP